MKALTLELATVRELARVLAERLDAVSALSPCPCCRDAEARAFLARPKRVLDDPAATEA